jgi:hypothetical protein
VCADPADGPGTERLLAAAHEAHREHTADELGRCAECLSRWRRLVPFPCETAKWARAVRAAYGERPG